jgi:Tetratricopeptide repeat.
MGASFTFAQKAERKNVREGNKLYKKEKYTESEISYRKSLEVNPRSIEGTYNLGNSLYKQGKFPEAAEQYQLIAAQEKDPVKLAQVFHNLGNISMKNKQYDKSVQAYRQSLRLNPKDDETRYNLALAQKLLENQQNQDQSEEQQNKDQKDDQKNKEDQQQNQQQQQDDKKQNKTRKSNSKMSK